MYFLFWLINLLREDFLTLLLSAFFGEEENRWVFGFITVPTLILASWKYFWIPSHKKTVWHICIEVEKTRESFNYKLYGVICVCLYGGVTFFEWVKDYKSEDVFDMMSNVFSLFLNVYQIVSIYDYDGPCHDEIGEYMRLSKIQFPKWKLGIPCFWFDSESLLTNLYLISLVKNSQGSTKVEDLKEREEFSYLLWDTVENFTDAEYMALAQAFRTRTGRKKNFLRRKQKSSSLIRSKE